VSWIFLNILYSILPLLLLLLWWLGGGSDGSSNGGGGGGGAMCSFLDPFAKLKKRNYWL